MYTSLNYTRVWHFSSRVRFHCICIISHIPAKTMASQTLPKPSETSETSMSLSAKPVEVPRCHTLPLSYCWTVVPYSSFQLNPHQHFCLPLVTCLPCHLSWLSPTPCFSLMIFNVFIHIRSCAEGRRGPTSIHGYYLPRVFPLNHP